MYPEIQNVFKELAEQLRNLASVSTPLVMKSLEDAGKIAVPRTKRKSTLNIPSTSDEMLIISEPKEVSSEEDLPTVHPLQAATKNLEFFCKGLAEDLTSAISDANSKDLAKTLTEKIHFILELVNYAAKDKEHLDPESVPEYVLGLDAYFFNHKWAKKGGSPQSIPERKIVDFYTKLVGTLEWALTEISRIDSELNDLNSITNETRKLIKEISKNIHERNSLQKYFQNPSSISDKDELKKLNLHPEFLLRKYLAQIFNPQSQKGIIFLATSIGRQLENVQSFGEKIKDVKLQEDLSNLQLDIADLITKLRLFSDGRFQGMRTLDCKAITEIIINLTLTAANIDTRLESQPLLKYKRCAASISGLFVQLNILIGQINDAHTATWLAMQKDKLRAQEAQQEAEKSAVQAGIIIKLEANNKDMAEKAKQEAEKGAQQSAKILALENKSRAMVEEAKQEATKIAQQTQTILALQAQQKTTADEKARLQQNYHAQMTLLRGLLPDEMQHAVQDSAFLAKIDNLLKTMSPSTHTFISNQENSAAKKITDILQKLLKYFLPRIPDADQVNGDEWLDVDDEEPSNKNWKDFFEKAKDLSGEKGEQLRDLLAEGYQLWLDQKPATSVVKSDLKVSVH